MVEMRTGMGTGEYAAPALAAKPPTAWRLPTGWVPEPLTPLDSDRERLGRRGSGLRQSRARKPRGRGGLEV